MGHPPRHPAASPPCHPCWSRVTLGAAWLRAARTAATLQGRSWASVGAATMRRGYGCAPHPEPQSCGGSLAATVGANGTHPWAMVLPALLVLGRGCTWSQVTPHTGGAGTRSPPTVESLGRPWLGSSPPSPAQSCHFPGRCQRVPMSCALGQSEAPLPAASQVPSLATPWCPVAPVGALPPPPLFAPCTRSLFPASSPGQDPSANSSSGGQAPSGEANPAPAAGSCGESPRAAAAPRGPRRDLGAASVLLQGCLPSSEDV